MNRLTAIGLASLVAYGLLIGSKYAGFVSAGREERGAGTAAVSSSESDGNRVDLVGLTPVPAPPPIATMPAPIARAQPVRASPIALDYRSARDLKAYTDALLSRRDTLTRDERYYLAKALEECQFATTVNEDLVAYSAKQERQFLSGLPLGDPLNAKRIAAYEAVDSSKRCVRFQGTKIASKDIEELYRFAAMQGDPRAQSRILVAELGKNLSTSRLEPAASLYNSVQMDDFSRIVSLLESQDPEAIMTVGQFLAQSAMTNQLRIGPNGEIPEPAAFLGAFSLVACDMGTECVSMGRELQLACAHGAYCNAQTYEELYQNFLAAPWTWSQAQRYRTIIYSAIRSRDWSLIGLRPKASYIPEKPAHMMQKSMFVSQKSFLSSQ